MTSTPEERDALREFDRELLRADFSSLFWAAINARKKRDAAYTMQQLADVLGRDKSVVSKWFSGDPQNWTIDTISDIAGALDLEIVLKARERSTDMMVTPTGATAKTAVRSATIKSFAGSPTHLTRMLASTTAG